MSDPTQVPPPPIPNPNIITPDQAKDPVLVLVLAVFLGGIAYLIFGQWQKGIAAIAAWVCLFAITLLTCGIGAILFFPFVVVVVIDAYMQAKLLKEGQTIGQWTFFNTHV
jgi:uncharacterized membrane protein YjjP (DUF1212 family)